MAEIIKLDNKKRQWRITDVGMMVHIAGTEVQHSNAKVKDIAEKAEVCQQTVRNLSSGKTRNPQLRTCLGILHALGFNMYVR
jgi:DNA-binding phage protein